MRVDYFGDIKGEGGVGNYSKKLFHALEHQDKLEMNHVDLCWSFPILEMTFQNLIELPYRVWKSDADIIHLTDQAKAGGLVLLPKSMTKNIVVTVHDISPYVNDYAGKFSQIISHFSIRGLKKAARLIAISQFTKDELIEHLGIEEKKTDVIYQGVDTEYFYPRDPDENILRKYGIEKPYILYVGSEINRKNIPGMLEKFQELQKENYDLSLVKVGPAGREKYRKQTLEAMEELGLEKGEDVVFTGFVDVEHLPQIYSSAEATILWSHYEGFGRITLESEACGTPVITEDRPPMNEWLPEDRFNLNLEFENEIIVNERFDWNTLADQLLKIYNKSIQSGFIE